MPGDGSTWVAQGSAGDLVLVIQEGRRRKQEDEWRMREIKQGKLFHLGSRVLLFSLLSGGGCFLFSWCLQHQKNTNEGALYVIGEKEEGEEDQLEPQ